MAKNPPAKCRRRRFDPWIGIIPWCRKWQLTPVFLPGKFRGQRSLESYSQWGCKDLDMTNHTRTITFAFPCVLSEKTPCQSDFIVLMKCSRWSLCSQNVLFTKIIAVVRLQGCIITVSGHNCLPLRAMRAESQSAFSYSSLCFHPPGKFLVYFRYSISIYRWIDGKEEKKYWKSIGKKYWIHGRKEVGKGERKGLEVGSSMTYVNWFVLFSPGKPQAMLLSKWREENTLLP